MNKRKEIRDKIKQILLDAATAAGSNVFLNRSIGWADKDYPGIAIYTPRERSEQFQEAPRVIKRTLEVELDLVDKFTDQNDAVDSLDLLAQEVEKALYLKDYLDLESVAIQHRYPLLISSNTALRKEQEKSIAGQTLTYEVVYHTEEPGTGDKSPGPFVGADIQTDQPPPDYFGPDVDAEDIVDLPQS